MLNHRFWRRLIILAAGLFLGGLVLGGLLMPRTAFTQATSSQGGAAKAAATQCSLATLKGTYVFAGDGYQMVGKNLVPFALAGNGVYDGSGHVQGLVSMSVNGQITRLIHYSGRYTVKADCTATETDTIPGAAIHFDEFITPDGSLFTLVETDPGVVTTEFESRGTGQRAGN